MTNNPNSTIVTFTYLTELVSKNKSANSARYYNTMLNRLKAYNGGESLSLENINSSYINGFGDYLIRLGLSSTSIGQMLKFLRSVLKESFGKEKHDVIKEAFRCIDTSPSSGRNGIGSKEILRLANPYHPLHESLDKIRLLFMYGLYGGSEDIHHEINTTGIILHTETRHQEKIRCDFAEKYCYELDVFARSISKSNYESGLNILGIKSGLSKRLTLKSSIDSWLNCALEAKIAPDSIARILPTNHSYMKHLIIDGSCKITDKKQILEKVGDFIEDLRPYWFAMRCLKENPQSINTQIKSIQQTNIETFIAPVLPSKIRKEISKSPVDSILFFKSSKAVAKDVKKHFRDSGYVYSNISSKSPAIIPEQEMQTFMLLCDIGGQSFSYYFPESSGNIDSIEISSQATITNGQFSGKVGIIKQVSDDKYFVTMEIEALGNMKIKAEVPTAFLRF